MSKHQTFSQTLQKLADNYKDVEIEFQELQSQSEQYKTEYLSQKEKCERKSCTGCKELQNVITSKDNTIQLVASVLTRLNETRNFSILNEAFKILCGEGIPTLTPPRDIDNLVIKQECSATFTEADVSEVSPKKDESVSEIEGTPTTGRTSPIIQSKKRTGRSTPESKVKKKFPNSWPSPEKKLIKLSFSASPRTPRHPRSPRKLRQSRLELVKGQRKSSLLDLSETGLVAARLGRRETMNKQSSSPDLSETGLAPARSRGGGGGGGATTAVRRECADNDTIMPSPTSHAVKPDFSQVFKANATMSSPVKLKWPSHAKVKCEDITRLPIKCAEINSPNTSATAMEESINLLQPFRFTNKQSPKRRDEPANITQDANIVSSSVLQHGEKVDLEATTLDIYSPSKRPLAENTNATNIPPSEEGRDLRVKLEPGLGAKENAVAKPSGSKRRTPEKQEDLFKEPTVRKKAEKLALPGWSCEQCRNFYDELYADNPTMLAKLMQECSKHRARRDPTRAATPPGYWQPRWDVPTDTEEFNRRNNA